MAGKHLQWVEISRGSYSRNIAVFRGLLPAGCRLMAVVKANAYGHGLLAVAGLAAENGADALGVNAVGEGDEIRRAGIPLPIVVLGYTRLDDLGCAVELGLEPVVYNAESLVRLDGEARKRGRRARFHLKLETGVNRQGVAERDLDRFAGLIEEAEMADLAACSMHFANIEDTTDHSFARRQMDVFARLRSRLELALGRPVPAHAACSAAAIVMPETAFQMARVGIGSYGLWPSKETYLATALLKKKPPVLEPVMSWKTVVAQVKDVPPGAPVGYGCAYHATRAMKVAVLPVGYSDGYDRGLSGQGHVLVRGHRAPVVGRVCMNMFMVDVTDVPGVSLEDEVVLLGAQGGERITAEAVASLCQTIHYETVSRVAPHIRRVVVE